MKKSSEIMKNLKNNHIVYIVLGLIINVFLSFIVHTLDLPLFFDCVGTIFVSALCGALPGIITAVATNFLSTAFNNSTIYFTIINVLIAIATTWYVKSGSKKNAPLYVILITLFGGVLGTVFQWLIFEAPQHQDVIYMSQTLSGKKSGALFFFASILINTGLNFIDKGGSAALAFLALRLFSEEKRTAIMNASWKQRPLSNAEVAQISEAEQVSGVLKKRISIILVVMMTSVVLIVSWICVSIHNSYVVDQGKSDAQAAALLVSKVVDGDKVDEYIKSGELLSEYDDESYLKSKSFMKDIFSSYPYMEYIYVYKIKEDGCYVVFDLDPSVQNKTYVGDREEFDEDFKEYLPDLFAGKEIDPIMVESRYGMFITAYEPIYDSAGNCVAYAGADISINKLSSFTKQFFIKLALTFSGFLLLILGCGFWLSRNYLIFPIGSMVNALEKFMKSDEEQDEMDAHVRSLKSLDIKTGDEIENLYRSICEMASNTSDQMKGIRYYANATAQMQNGLIMTMADMVENRDSDTGAHVQKTAAYVRIILEGLKKKGYYVDRLTDKYISDVEMSAPLHDVGKINIPDAVLNKPGKLTDEEYEIMKTHTTAGKAIIEKAINTVKGGSYLKEARNMAAYHHERWDGKGYPEGLAGEVIPLSARVMAVADVFDALSSPRVYKPAFPLEKALSIIQEGSGSQFDPRCVEVFMDSLPEVKLILAKFHEE